ncbi:hypothetical protein DFJ66_8361 [Saccharothrix variisporea]|uniref:Roadblock/LAMTOR2 domain-containing protein n=1 Tax=Saccharothrix variisporea TaxID=543527 RepID=A0A495XQ31_9PSEU|nr:hypothetical protein DFJ66_8361 [Saccharothrix variisporea]
MDYDALAAELRALRENVPGITDTLIAASDGIPIIGDVVRNVDPAHISALAAADHGIARQAAEVMGLGGLSQTVVFGSEGYLAVYAINRMSLMVVLGDKGLNLGRLLHESRAVIDRVGAILTPLAQRPPNERNDPAGARGEDTLDRPESVTNSLAGRH